MKHLDEARRAGAAAASRADRGSRRRNAFRPTPRSLRTFEGVSCTRSRLASSGPLRAPRRPVGVRGLPSVAAAFWVDRLPPARGRPVCPQPRPRDPSEHRARERGGASPRRHSQRNWPTSVPRFDAHCQSHLRPRKAAGPNAHVFFWALLVPLSSVTSRCEGRFFGVSPGRAEVGWRRSPRVLDLDDRCAAAQRGPRRTPVSSRLKKSTTSKNAPVLKCPWRVNLRLERSPHGAVIECLHPPVRDDPARTSPGRGGLESCCEENGSRPMPEPFGGRRTSPPGHTPASTLCFVTPRHNSSGTTLADSERVFSSFQQAILAAGTPPAGDPSGARVSPRGRATSTSLARRGVASTPEAPRAFEQYTERVLEVGGAVWA